MWESANTTASNGMVGFNSQLSFYEYPSHKPFINTTHQPLRPSFTLSATAALPESNRDNLLTSLQSLSLKIKHLENERQRAETNLREMTNGFGRIHSGDYRTDSNERKRENDRHGTINSMLNYPLENQHNEKIRPNRKKKGNNQRMSSSETASNLNSDGRHYHLDMNTVPFILGASTSPSHNVKSNVQNVIALLKKHNHQLCLTSKEYAELLNPSTKSDLSPNTLLYIDHYNKCPSRSLSSSPVRPIGRRVRTSSLSRRSSITRRPQTATLTNKQCYSRIKSLQQEFSKLAREHKRLNTSRTNIRELTIINERMKIILQELEQIQGQLRIEKRRNSLTDLQSIDRAELALDTLKKTRLIQILLRDPHENDQQQRRRSNRKF